MLYFLAEYLVSSFFGTDHSAIKNARGLLERLSLTSLESLAIQFEPSEIKDDRLCTAASRKIEGPLDKGTHEGAKNILLIFLSGVIAQRGLVGRLDALLSDLSGKNSPAKTDQRETIQSLALSSITGPLWLSENLLLLKHCRSRQLEPNRQPAPIDVSGLSCPLSHLATIIGNDTDLRVSRPANMEFAILPEMFDSKTSIQSLHRELPGRFEELGNNKLAQKALLEATKTWNVGFLGDYRIILGGERYVGSYDHKKSQSYEQAEQSGPQFKRVLLPTFLIQSEPVTNRDFLRFIRHQNERGNREWDPIVVRDTTRNDYYLRHWDQIGLKKLLAEKEVAWGSDSSLKNWGDAPVIYVNWKAANAYAEWVNCRLPTETEYEVAARSFQPQELYSSQQVSRQPSDDTILASDLPWSAELVNCQNGGGSDSPVTIESALSGYVLDYPIPDGTADPAEFSNLFPYIRVKLTEPGRFDDWSKRVVEGLQGLGVTQHLAERLRPISHLVGGLRYWMADCWNPNWPPINREVTNSQGTTYLEAPYQDGWCKTLGDKNHGISQAKNWRDNEKRQRVLRGTSLQMSSHQMRISYRESQRETNVNPDVGFRCVQVLWPGRMINIYPFR
jgi:formylglycine-generating enzyme required for sulfatase activity